MRVAIVGNSGSGKSTLARRLSEAAGAAVLDLDTVAWDAGPDAVPRDRESARRDVEAFCAAHAHWVVEGCYAGLIAAALAFRPHLVFLDPGVERCVANCRARPWEPHKFPSREAQDAQLAMLLDWVRNYDRRADPDLSRAGHRALFDSYDGPRTRVVDAPGDEFVRALVARR